MSIHKNTGFLKKNIVFSLCKSSEFQLFKQPLEVKSNPFKGDCCLVPQSPGRLIEDPIKCLYFSAKPSTKKSLLIWGRDGGREGRWHKRNMVKLLGETQGHSSTAWWLLDYWCFKAAVVTELSSEIMNFKIATQGFSFWSSAIFKVSPAWV